MLDEARATLAGADAKARELSVTGDCATRTSALLEKLGQKAVPRAELTIAHLPVAGTPPLVASDGRPAGPSNGGTATGAAPASQLNGTATRTSPAQLESTRRRDR